MELQIPTTMEKDLPKRKMSESRVTNAINSLNECFEELISEKEQADRQFTLNLIQKTIMKLTLVGIPLYRSIEKGAITYSVRREEIVDKIIPLSYEQQLTEINRMRDASLRAKGQRREKLDYDIAKMRQALHDLEPITFDTPRQKWMFKYEMVSFIRYTEYELHE